MAKQRNRQSILQKRAAERKAILRIGRPAPRMGKLTFPTPAMLKRLVELGVPRDLAARMPRANAYQTIAAANASHGPSGSRGAPGLTAGQWRQMTSEGREATDGEAAALRRRGTGPYDNGRRH